jgi:hypothetical protein
MCNHSFTSCIVFTILFWRAASYRDSGKFELEFFGKQKARWVNSYQIVLKNQKSRFFSRPTGVTKTPNSTHEARTARKVLSCEQERQFAAFWQTVVHKLIRYQ